MPTASLPAFGCVRIAPRVPVRPRACCHSYAFFLSVLAGCLLIDAAGAHADETFSFVQITDLHIGGGTDHVQRTSRAIDAINALPLPIACVLVTGDLVNNNLTDLAALGRVTNLLARLHAPTCIVPGNHDVLASHWDATTNAYVRAFGPLTTNFTCHGVVFLGLCDEMLRNSQIAAQHPGCDPLPWLEAQLKAAATRPVIVIHHSACVDDFHGNAFHEGWPETVRQRWITLVNRYHVRAEIVGHYHRDELEWVGDVPVYLAAPLAGYYGRQASFRIYTWHDGHLSYRTVYLDP